LFFSFIRFFSAVVIAAYFLQGCTAVGPDYIKPEPEMPDRWTRDLVKGMAEGQAVLQTWWTVLNDPVLNELMEKAAEGNFNLKVAYARIKEARGFLGIATGERVPDLNASGIAVRQRAGDDFASSLVDNPDNFTSLGFDSSWEIDFWGRIRRSVESAEAGVEASVENYRDALVILFSEIARNYVDARTLQSRIRFAEGNILTQKNTLKVTKDRLDAEISPELDVFQAELNLARTESILPRLKTALIESINRIGVLTGRPPGAMHELLAPPASIPKADGDVLVGIPSDLMRQRPDIRRAERELASQTALIGVAEADLYPRFTLFGEFGLEATSSLFDSDNRYYSFGPSFRWNIFSAGRIRSRIMVEDAKTEQLLAAYEQSVLNALEEVENAMVAYAQEQDRRNILIRSVSAARKSVKLVDQLYKLGLTDFQNLLDMEKSLFEQQDQLAESEGSMVRSLIALYRAMGGGWSPEQADMKMEK
jgi:NodT family efflux transporter outer membrane factor (OMF) lipoprotein